MNYRKEHPLKLRVTQIEYLLSLAEKNREEGVYWGRRDQFKKMEDLTIRKLQTAQYGARRKHENE